MSTRSYSTDDVRHVDAHRLLEHIGGYGMYEMINFTLVTTVNFYYAAAMFVMSFIEDDPHLLCVSNQTDWKVKDQCAVVGRDYVEERCDYSKKATLYVLDKGPVESLFPLLGLLCSSGLVKEFGLTFFTVGAFITVPFISMAADRFGRKSVILICISVSSMANLLVYVTNNAYIFWILRFIIGATSDGYLTIANILSTELVAQDVRDWYGLLYNVFWSGGLLYTSLLSLFIRDWKMFYLVACLPSLIFFPVYALCLPETPHWLCEHKKFRQLWDYVKISENFNARCIDLADCMKSEKRKNIVKCTKSPIRQIYEAFVFSKLFLAQMLINGFIQFVLALFYFTVTLESTKLTDDGFIGFALSAGIELPGGILTLPALKYFGRRTCTWVSLCLQGVFIALYPFTPYAWLAISFNLISKIFNGIVYSSHPLLLTEMIPTGMRTAMYSLVNIPQSFGIIGAPYLKYLQFGTTYVMYMILAVISIAAGLLALILPETKGRRLPEHINDLMHSSTEKTS
ncbi:unnamed protein product [Bursaphelenchus okinawaensis]|uniref:Major facilitator superfamily (MFS) profile domain-containing protein n=1 Tax=Bursaphelenchus okinawaensis TaxID=465554 RepID=A0A811L6X0_9BILA|nr:unnamed protein product [Bursaphelenchus okinawaensis]CAG9116952.1 unnamed protein product [Bursaphelenchus okinawaensis]